MERIMTNIQKLTSALRMVLATLAVTSAQAQTTLVLQEWQFTTQANPSTPEIAPGVPAEARATIQEGRFASGWIDRDGMLGSSKGIWDLGRKGTIALNKWSAEAGPSTTSRDITVKVTQWYDGGIYGSLSMVEMPGARLVNRSQVHSESGSIGDWVTDETHWTIDVGAEVESIVVTSPENGGLIDKISVEMTIPEVVPPALSIQNQTGANGFVNVSWPTASASSWQLEATTHLGDPQSWEPVSGQPQVIGGRFVLAVQKEGTHFFRLKRQ
jgi:hypothetical protein